MTKGGNFYSYKPSGTRGLKKDHARGKKMPVVMVKGAPISKTLTKTTTKKNRKVENVDESSGPMTKSYFTVSRKQPKYMKTLSALYQNSYDQSTQSYIANGDMGRAHIDQFSRSKQRI